MDHNDAIWSGSFSSWPCTLNHDFSDMYIDDTIVTTRVRLIGTV